MKIIVCPLSKLEQMVATHTPERVVSLLDPDFSFPELGPAYQHRHLRLHLHDVHEWAPEQVVPGQKHVEELLAFLADWQRASPLLVHCRAGISPPPPRHSSRRACTTPQLMNERSRSS